MKSIPIFVLLFFFCLELFGQTEYRYDYKKGYEFILKAEKNFKKGNFVKAEEFISKAKNSDYGFCGNAWASAYSRIAMTEVEIFNAQKKYDVALTILDSLQGCGFGADCETRD